MRNFIVILLVLSVFFAFGCISSQPESSSPKEVMAGVSADSSGNLAVIKQSFISVKVTQGTLNDKFAQLKSDLGSLGAQISDVSFSDLGTRSEYRMTIKVTPDKFDSVNDLLRDAGQVMDLSVSTEDASRQSAELDIRIQNRETELERLNHLYNQSTNVSSILEIEREVSRVESELELLKDQKRYLVSRIDRATVSLVLFEEKSPLSQLGFSLEGLSSGFIGALAASVSFIVYLSGFLIPIAVVGGILWFIYKKVQGLGSKVDSGPKPRKTAFSRIPPQE